MENYRLFQRLGKGAQGAVFIAEERSTKNKYVLKKVECNDQSEATKAFKEAMALQNLKHKHTCGYKEFFVTWDKEESAMCVCIVMEYYKMGDLDNALKLKRAKQDAIEELTLKKWFGQMLDALVFVHDKKIIHRDLKPSNIFLTDKLDVSIGDFGVATIMDDARTRSRTTVGTMNWMAPEVLEKPAYDERSDIWSLGCILLEIATCGFMDSADMSAELFQIKSSPECLERILANVAKEYSNLNLCQVIRMMLRINFQQRPSAKQLCELPYVQECLVLAKSDLAENTKKTCSEAKHVPTTKGVAGVIAFMKENSDSTQCQVEALEYLVKYTKNQDVPVNDDCKMTVAATMKEHVSAQSVQQLGCKFFLNLIPVSGEGDVLYSKEVINPILLAMRSHAKSAELQTAACQLLMAFSADEYVSEAIGKLGGLQDILAAMRAFPDNAEIAVCSCSAIWSICVNEQNCKIVSEEQGLKDIHEAMANHADNADVIEAACSAIWSLSMEDDLIDKMADLEIVSTMIEALNEHTQRPKVVKNAVMAFASMVEEKEIFAYSLSCNKGIEAVINAYKNHKDNEEVVENICIFFLELAEYDDICEEMKALRVADILTEAKKQYKANAELSAAAGKALVPLVGGGGGQQKERTPSARSRCRSARAR